MEQKSEREVHPMMSPEQTIKEIKEQGGLVLIPHPYDEKRKKTVLSNIAQKRIAKYVDFIEVHNGRNISSEYDQKQLECAERLKALNPHIIFLNGSDAHTSFEIGRNYITVTEKLNKGNIRQEISKAVLHNSECIEFAHRWTKCVKGIRLLRNLEIMQYHTLSIDEVRKRSNQLAEIIEKNYRPDCIVFVAKGGFVVGKALADYFDVPLVEAVGHRQGNKMKKILSPIFKHTPKRLRFRLIELEMRAGVHQKSEKRDIKIANDSLDEYTHILVVDDSVDTGNTMLETVEEIRRFTNADIKTAALSVIKYSEEKITTDYYLYKDTIIRTGTSKDSEEYEEFLKEYDSWHSEI